MNTWTNRQTDDKQTNKHFDDKQTDRQTDRWSERQTDKPILFNHTIGDH